MKSYKCPHFVADAVHVSSFLQMWLSSIVTNDVYACIYFLNCCFAFNSEFVVAQTHGLPLCRSKVFPEARLIPMMPNTYIAYKLYISLYSYLADIYIIPYFIIKIVITAITLCTISVRKFV